MSCAQRGVWNSLKIDMTDGWMGYDNRRESNETKEIVYSVQSMC